MADPTIKDVLEAVQGLAGGLDETRRDVKTLAGGLEEVRRDVKGLTGGLEEVRRDVAEVRRDVKELDANVEAHRAETKAGFDRVDRSIAELGEDIDKHMVVHKKLEKQVETLKGKPARPPARALRRR